MPKEHEFCITDIIGNRAEDYHDNKLKNLKYLWKINEPEWLKKREDDWLILLDSSLSDTYSLKELTEMKPYFIKGDYVGYINILTRFLLTPFTCPKEASIFFNQYITDSHDKKSILSHYLDKASRIGSEVSWQINSIRSFVQGCLGEEYKKLEMKNGSVNRVYSPDPTIWCISYMKKVIKLLSGEIPYHGIIEALPYFISALAYTNNAKRRKPKIFNDMMVMIETSIANPLKSSIAFEFAQELKKHEKIIRDNWEIHASLDDA